MYISIVVLSWGIIASMQSISTSFGQLLILRTILGVAEAAFTGVPFYLSFFYRREELAFRTAIFISAAPLATSFASSLAWVITALTSVLPIAPWRLLLLVEGFPSVFVAWYCFTHIANSPETAWFLGKRERAVAINRLKEDRQAEGRDTTPGVVPKVKLSEIIQAVKDPKCYLKGVSAIPTESEQC
jgi:MFS family permease